MAGTVYACAILWLAPLSLWISCPVKLLLSAFSSMAGTVYACAILCLAPFEPGVLFMPGTIRTCIFIYAWHHCYSCNSFGNRLKMRFRCSINSSLVRFRGCSRSMRTSPTFRPGRSVITTTRSHKNTASSKSWVTRIKVDFVR